MQPRFPDFLKNEATLLEVSGTGQTEAAATYVDGETVKKAIRQACPRFFRCGRGLLRASLPRKIGAHQPKGLEQEICCP